MMMASGHVLNVLTRIVATCVVSILFVACAQTPDQAAERTAKNLAASTLRTFKNMEEFEEYRARLREAAQEHDVWWAATIRGNETRTLFATNETSPCNAAIEDCIGGEVSEVAVTAAKISKRSSITNNQEADVDEGDIVKQYGRFLIVLQDGRLFSVDTGATVGELRLADRIDVYSSANTGTWYDELLVHGNNLIVTGFNYMEDASEINVITIGDAGELDFQARYYIESEDYYSGNNYASRLVRGRFVVYTPLYLADTPTDEPLHIPRIRRWTPDEGFSQWQPLFSITDVYRPIQPTLTPTLHVISVCRIKVEQTFGCDSRGVVGPAHREVYVSSDNVYLWLTSDHDEWAHGNAGTDSCPEAADLYRYPARRSTVFQLPVESARVRAAHTMGAPYDQFAFDERDDSLLALLVRSPRDCYLDGVLPMMFTSLPLSFFSTAPQPLDANRYAPLTNATGDNLTSRFTKDHVIYGAGEGRWYRWRDEQRDTSGEIVAVPLSRPSRLERLRTSHMIDRLEVLGDHAVAFGAQGKSNLGVSTIWLERHSAIADTLVLPEIAQSEGRSHAFNSLVDDRGEGLFGLPTTDESRLRYWNHVSDVQFFATDAQLRMRTLGELAGQVSLNKGYECEVSCIDWYGNARPIFIEGRVFALTGSELIEGQRYAAGMAEMGRLQLTGTPQRERPNPAH